MADQSDPTGCVSASVRELGLMCGMSDRTVQRAMERLVKPGFVRIVQPGTPVASHRYRLTLPGVRQSPGVSVTPGVSESAEGCQAVGTLLPSLDPLKSIKAEPAKPRARYTQRKEEPTPDQVTKLAHVLWDDPAVQIATGEDFDELLKCACAQAGFVYNTAVVDVGIKRMLPSKGIDPKNWRLLNLQQLRRRSR